MANHIKITDATRERLNAVLAVVGMTQGGAVVRRALVRYLDWAVTLTPAELIAEGREIRRTPRKTNHE
jgi:hypothetical protein